MSDSSEPVQVVSPFSRLSESRHITRARVLAGYQKVVAAKQPARDRGITISRADLACLVGLATDLMAFMSAVQSKDSAAVVAALEELEK